MKGYLNNKILVGMVAITLAMASCDDMYNLPADKDFISENLTYSTKILEPTLGRTTVYNPLNADNSTRPMTFEIINPRYGDGRPVSDFLQSAQIYEWIEEYTGEETSLQEIEAKRRLVQRPIFEVDEGGRFIMWASGNNENIEPRPMDTLLKTQDIRFFDLKISNTGGVRYIRDFQLIPWREIPYLPSTDINPYTGGVAPDPISPKDPRKRAYIVPNRLSNVIGQNTNVPLVNNNDKKDVVVYIRPFEGGNGQKLRFVFLDPAGNPINPAEFNETRWDELIHGFNRNSTDEYVEYDVAYPIPLMSINTPYSSGDRARVNFSYSRVGWGGTRTTGTIGLDFKIFRKGDWEIVFHFRNDSPKFDNE